MAEAALIDHEQGFASFDLDDRLLRAISKIGFSNPTLIQSKAIPLALSGKDILARARTGSGKTAAYCLPTLEKLLKKKEALSPTDPEFVAIRALILVPTRELAEQVTDHIKKLITYCTKEISVVNIAGNIPVQLQKPMLAEKPDVIVATPSRVLAHLESNSLSLRDTLETLVIDEADLVLSFGYEEDVRKILTFLPKIYQSFLMSATLTKDVESLKALILRNPAILKLEEEKDDVDNLTQYCVRCTENEKFLLIYVILKLRLIKGKCVLFVNDIERCYRLKLFLEQFSIKSCTLNSELPLNSRYHIVQEFNKGIYDYIIATDESALQGEKDTDDEDSESDEEATPESKETGEGEEEASEDAKKKSTKRKKSHRPDKEYGVSRGVDFQNVAAVINFDFPKSAKSYTHRVGRTARGGQKGMSLSFVVTKEEGKKNATSDETVFARVEKQQADEGATIKPYMFDMKQVEGFKYRIEDALRAVTRVAVREARIKELKHEILHSEKLKAHFEDKPKDLAYLRHDKPLHPSRVQSHLKHVPEYLMPKIAGPAAGDNGNASLGHIPFKKNDNRRRGGKQKFSGNKKRKSDPLKTFSAGSGKKHKH
ncbi:DEAD-domain-containing protein [Basidiobolus meristosporus CBS 931.73]|uniref:ATP-dependent RNA helicase DBP9 n=1 Tax=Basidiobolus meristosporus CBS 931.73 TaxID=1314790 RepID=A0A1Y1XHD8_9FUNG|nr:DEAD-domain-containing protein [Basidiobolus meristosporus CBS 931.73]|eukprot:ORX85165.1 DEAD-domain-containing protein [Basidiobolus meristosporus CBS 931.73]